MEIPDIPYNKCICYNSVDKSINFENLKPANTQYNNNYIGYTFFST